MTRTLALLICDQHAGFFGHPRKLDDVLGKATVLEHAVRRAAAIPGVDDVVLLHPHDQAPPAIATLSPCDLRIDPSLRISRAWNLTGWRGGLGTSTIYDEALQARAAVDAMQHHNADHAVLLRADWPFHDPALSGEALRRFREAPDSLKMCFTQAAPGLSGIATGRAVLEQFGEHHANFGKALGYNPRHASADPIGKDVCVPCPVEARDAYTRFVHDTPRSQAMLQRIADALGNELHDADAQTIARTARTVAMLDSHLLDLPYHPRYATLELTPQRPANGSLTAQHHQPAILDRAPLTMDHAHCVLQALGASRDIPVLLGGLGDALLHPQWADVLKLARQHNVLAVGVQTDLACDDAALMQLIDAQPDVIQVRLNADRIETYRPLMGDDTGGLNALIQRLQTLFDLRNKAQSPTWIVPSFVKTRDNLVDMESFFEKWTLIAGHALIERASVGRDAQGQPYRPDPSPVNMTPPKQAKWPDEHLHILSNGVIAADADDWLGERAIGHLDHHLHHAGAGV